MARLALLEKHPQYVEALAIVQKLQHRGFEALLAGGCVRDALLGVVAKDLDIAPTIRRAYATTNILFLILPSLLRSFVCSEINPLARRQPLELPLQSSVNPKGAALVRKGYWSWQSPTTDWWRTVPTTVPRKTRQYLFTFTFSHFLREFCM